MSMQKIEDIADKILDIILLLEVAKDSCIANEYYGQETLLNIILEEQHDIYEKLENLY